MKIVCLVRSLEMGGVERQISGLAVLLKQAGHEVEIIKYIPRDFFEGYLKENDIPVTYIPKKGGALGLAKKIASHIKENSIDLVIAFASSASTKACLAKMFYGNFKLVVSERNFIKTFLPNDWIRFALYSKAEWVVSNSYAQHNHVVKAFPSLNKKASAIVNFVDINKFTPLENKHIEGPIKVAIISRVSRRKNTHGLIKAIKTLENKGLSFKVDWYGATRQSRYFKKCQRLISELGLESVFEIKNAVHDVKSIYHSYDLCALPSFYEGTPNAVCEALACGLPVVCSDVSDNAIYVRPGQNGWLFDPRSTQSIASAFEEAISAGRDKYALYGKMSRSIAEERLTIERFRREYLELIENLSKSKS